MWQRIQTLYLLISTALMISLIFSIKAFIPGADGSYLEEYRYAAYTPYLILLIVISLLNLLALTSYKFREFQMRTAVLVSIITLALQAWLAVDYFTASENLVFKFTAVFPFISVILDLLAAKNIASDIMVADSVNRLRSKKKKHR